MYIDPVSGSMILQVAAAAVISGLAAMSRARQTVRRLFRKLFSRSTD
jgi:hypothetical protein